MIVTDASVFVAALAQQGHDAVWAAGLIGSQELVAPQLVTVEVANTLRALERRDLIAEWQALAALEDMLLLDVALAPFAPVTDRVWELRHNLTAYDAWYVAVAEFLRVPLATLDRRLASAVGPECEFFVP